MIEFSLNEQEFKELVLKHLVQSPSDLFGDKVLYESHYGTIECSYIEGTDLKAMIEQAISNIYNEIVGGSYL